ncbi:cation:proton antiporter [Williamsia sp.]|uniref:cation:proton antiporter n=1 Tax=Williamsia sp. TaxID=1872085 RepID=UPI002F92AB4B
MPIASAPAPFIDQHALLVLLLQLACLLAVAVVMGWAARKVGLPTIVGELLAGVVLGPSILGLGLPDLQAWLFPADAGQQNLLDAVGMFGVILLVGLAATELDTAFIRRKAAVVTSVSAFAFLVPLGLGVGAGLLMPPSLIGEGTSPTVFALFLGTALSVSAIPVIAKILTEMKLLHRNLGQVILASGTVDDALGWILLAITSSMATAGVRTGEVAQAVAATLGAVVVAVCVLRPVAHRLFDKFEASEQRSHLPVVVAVVIFACAGATQAMHLEAILGAFLAGLIVGQRKPELLAPLRTVTVTILAPIFLATAGLRVDLTELAHTDVLVAAVVILLLAVVGKFIGAYVGARIVRQPRWEAVALGAGLNARGAVEIIIAMVGLRIGVLTTATYTIVVLVAIVTSVMAPPLLKLAMARVDHSDEEVVREKLRTA